MDEYDQADTKIEKLSIETLEDIEKITERTPIISVIIPTLNEKETIGICIEKIQQAFQEMGVVGEIIVSDSSNDGTPEIAESMGARVVKPDRKGYGYAYIYAFQKSLGEFIVIGDGDNTYDFSQIQKFIEPLVNDEADLVIGSRFKGEIKQGAMSRLHRYIGNPLLTWILNILFNAGISDAHCGMRAITREALNKMNLSSIGMELASEMIISATRMELRIIEIPIIYYPRKGESKLSSLLDGWRHLKFMLLYAPPNLFLIPGLGMTLIGIIGILSVFFGISVGFIPGLHSMIASNFMFIIGYQLLLLALAAQLYGEKVAITYKRNTLKKVTSRLNLEKGIVLGVSFIFIGLIYLLRIYYDWAIRGYKTLPINGIEIISYSLITIGIITTFNAFLISTIKEK